MGATPPWNWKMDHVREAWQLIQSDIDGVNHSLEAGHDAKMVLFGLQKMIKNRLIELDDYFANSH
jgi:hypothetical protein